MNVDLAQLEQHLSQLPGQIRTAEKTYIESQGKVENAKLSLSVAQARAMTESEEPNAQGKKAESIIATREEQHVLIQLQVEMDTKKAELEYLKNRFTALRKIASVETELIRSQLIGN